MLGAERQCSSVLLGAIKAGAALKMAGISTPSSGNKIEGYPLGVPEVLYVQSYTSVEY